MVPNFIWEKKKKVPVRFYFLEIRITSEYLKVTLGMCAGLGQDLILCTHVPTLNFFSVKSSSFISLLLGVSPNIQRLEVVQDKGSVFLKCVSQKGPSENFCNIISNEKY